MLLTFAEYETVAPTATAWNSMMMMMTTWIRAVVVYVYSNDETLCLIIGSTLKCIRRGVEEWRSAGVRRPGRMFASLLTGALATVQKVELRS